MMTENEQLARWLDLDSKIVVQIIDNDVIRGGVPNFRSSNEWAGAVFEQILLEGYVQDLFQKILIRLPEEWRDAVVDTALEIIKRGPARGEYG